MDATLPEVSFASYDPDAILAALIADYETAAGRTLGAADPIRLFLSTIAAAIIQERFLLDDAARNNLLQYARGDFLEVLGDLVGVTRLPASAGSCTLEFTLAEAPGEGNSLTVPAGTRVAKADTLYYWATDADLVISDDATTGEVSATCLTVGTITNGFAIGEISGMVDIVAGVYSARNTTVTADGADEETDEPLRARIRLAPTAFSGAGPVDAYKFWARSASPLIVDVSVVSPDPGEVDVYVLLTGGELPDPTMLDLVQDTLTADTVRPLTDLVTAKAPTAVPFSVVFTYYIQTDDSARAAEIQAAVAQAVTDYVSWQTGAIGRDVNPSMLHQAVMAAGARRVVITNPAYVALGTTEVASLAADPTVVYGGLEDD